ncbi:C4b-binding protein beta chain isoform X2 [Moschus berezovskii]|uniref:C4b-binding protein beta chain isoform X2 n=1 Tax=Moschus berezovskii TaxID=68408 RepID=UPI002443D234|nr:C4b-binding protein beta chain isoform X2 [Moschus berezovskii]
MRSGGCQRQGRKIINTTPSLGRSDWSDLKWCEKTYLIQARVLGWVISNPGQTIDPKMFFWLMCYLVDVWLIFASDESLGRKERGCSWTWEKTRSQNTRSQAKRHLDGDSMGHCPDPLLVTDEFSSLEPVNVNDTIRFKCNEHCILKGSNWSQCQENHTWMTHFPVCKSRDCDPPETPAHGYFEGRDFKSGSTITYYCEARYHLVGTQHRQCINGEWTSAPPICELIQEAPKAAELELEKAFLAFQESKELCKAIKKFTQRLKKSGFTMEKVKYSLERKKAKLKAKMLP